MRCENVTLSSISVGGQGSYGINASAVNFSDDLYTYLRITDITDDGRINKSGLKSVNDEKANLYILKPNDIVFARTGASTGRNYFYDGRDGIFVYAGFLIKFSLDPHKVNPKYIKYYCMSDKYKNWIRAFIGGSTRGNINAKTLGDMQIPLPPRSQQNNLVSILSLLDDKIELNNRINENLEQQARAIFRAWFVDFLPFNGVMPSDWKIETLGNVTVNLRERVKDKINYPVFSAISSGDLILSDDFFSKRVYSKNISNYIIVNENNFAYNPARINIGSIGINDFDYKGCVSPVYIVLKVAEGYEGYFYFYFKSKRFRAESLLRASGSVRQTLNYSDFSLIEVIYPSREYAEKFNDIYQTLCKAKKTYNNQTRTLAQIRDSLLPKLISGELDISGLDL